MKKYCEMSREELLDLKKELDREFDEIKAEGLALDMSRGKPAPDQLDLSMKMMEVLAGDADLKCETGVDCRERNVRYHCTFLFPRSNGKYTMVQA